MVSMPRARDANTEHLFHCEKRSTRHTTTRDDARERA
jgi:hypothetical protein